MNFKTFMFVAVIAGGAWWHFKHSGPPDALQIEMPDEQGGVVVDTAGLPPEQRRAIEEALRGAKTPEEIERRLAGISAQMESMAAANAPGVPPARKFALDDYNDRYQSVTLHGWSVRVSRELVTQANDLAMSALTAIDAQLDSIERALPAKRLAALRLVPIWLELKVQGMDVLVYHPDGRWLSKRGLNAEKGGGIDIPDINGFLMNVGQQPGMILHELTHAYHLRALGEKNEDIVRAYQNAKTAGLYAQVKSVDGSVGAAYASNNEKEYFAEITEAYFLKNDFFPFTREELRSYDPGGYALVENLWLKR